MSSITPIIRTLLVASVLGAAPDALAAGLSGAVHDSDGAAVVGAMVSASQGDPIRSVTVFTDHSGAFQLETDRDALPVELRVRRIGYRDLRLAEQTLPAAPLRLVLERETDPAALAAQLPANRWYALLLERIEDEGDREELVRQCTYCHQQGNRATRLQREDWQWEKILALMARMGGTLSADLRAQVPALFNAAYDPATAVPALTAGMDAPDFAPPPSAEVRTAVIDEWELGGRASMQHDLVVHPDGHIYSVDMTQDRLYRLDPEQPGVGQEVFEVPQGDLPLGGLLGGGGQPLPSTANSRQGPHSVQVAPDGGVWMTLALGNELARFDPVSEAWSRHPLPEGFYPHTLRIDSAGRIWFTVAVSNHLGMFDPASGSFRTVRLPARTWGQAVALRMLPAMIWLSQRFDLSSAASSGEGVSLPVPYGVDIAPDGGVWFSQLNEHRIGRLDPETFEYEMIDTPFTAPRRLRFDSRGNLWIPGFSSGLISRFDPETREFDSYPLPIEPLGSETPYALHVDRRNDAVWICGTNSDTLIRFEPGTDQGSERFVVYPLPTRVTYTREIDFDAQGRVWTSNSNMPTWQIEGGFPRVLRLDPRGDAAVLAGLEESRP